MYERGPNYKNKMIFRMQFYHDEDEVIHTRKVLMYMDWLGIIGGLRGVISTIFIGILFKGFSNFNSLIETLNSTTYFHHSHA